MSLEDTIEVPPDEMTIAYRGGRWMPTMDLDRPVFILACARSGSTLLRFILDAHPELACAAETEFASACDKLAHMWGALQGINPRGSFSLQVRTGEANLAIKRAIDEAVRSYLHRQGKARWCDKSLDNVLNVDLLAQMWPQAKFICLTRHCMDVIASAAESTRWGLSGFGFNLYATRHGNNTVAAVGDYWAERTGAILAFQQRHPERCHSVRYEDLVTRPDETVTKLLAFIGVAEKEDITESCFRVAHEPGPGDEKIWLTTRVHSDSLGRGTIVPVRAMPAPMRERVNRILTQLGHDLITENWNASRTPPPGHQRFVSTAAMPDQDSDQSRSPHSEDAQNGWIPIVAAKRLEQAAVRWPHLEGRVLGVSFRVSAEVAETQTWRIGAGCGDSNGSVPVGQPHVVIDGDLPTWHSVLGGGDNFVAACLNGRLAIVGHTPTGWPAIPDEAHAIAFLLGLAPVPVAVSRLSTAAAAARRGATTPA